MSPDPEPSNLHVLVVGGGGREHALAWACSRSPRVGRVTCAPGNAGTSSVAENRALAATDAPGLVALAQAEKVDLVILGPDAAVAAGVGDAMREAGVACFGPGREAGRLESSKVFAKKVMASAGVATAGFAAFEDAAEARRYLRGRPGPIVVKADGLALGKGVFVCAGEAEAEEAVERLLVRRELGAAGARVLLEERLDGEEVSLFAICDGDGAVMLPPARDYKRALDGNLGGNTGGMGAYCPGPGEGWRELNRRALEDVVEPTLAEMRRRGAPYRGCLYVGGILVQGRLQVLEFNARFGDPEAEVQLPLLPDLVPLLWQGARGRLRGGDPVPAEGACLGVVAVRAPYPEPVSAGGEVSGVAEAEAAGCVVFQMGTRPAGPGGTEVSGGRVLICTAQGGDLGQARDRAYAGLASISFAGMRYRLDIGA
ncbi:MAG TPA: phosphoribosylamine--glycine ligase [Candidatus Dormibacteraeota bacterium]